MFLVSESYYLRHRAEILAYSKQYYEAHRVERSVSKKCARLRKIGLYRANELRNCKRWRVVNLDKYRAMKFAQNHVPLGDCCEFCGSKVDLTRFLPDYAFPVIVVTICRFCRGSVRKSLVVCELL
jgi:hypothetical protein